MATVRAGKAVHAPNLGLYLDRPPLLVPERGLVACQNVRIANKQIISDNLGWSKFPDTGSPLNLDGRPVLLVDSFRPRNGTNHTIFGNTTDLFEYNTGTKVASYITPRYETGTVTATNGSPNLVGVGTLWLANMKTGDYISVGATGRRLMTDTWYKVLIVVDDTHITLSTNYVGAAAGVAYTGRKTFTGDLTHPYFTEIFYNGVGVSGGDGDRWYACNGLDANVGWDGATDQVYRPAYGGSMDACGFIRRFKNVMFFIAPRVAGNLRTYAVKTSAIGQPENISTLEASEFIINDGQDELLCAHPIGELLAIYSGGNRTNGDGSVVVAQFVGSPVMYAFRTAVSNIGARSARSVATFADHHLMVGKDTLYRFDGVTARPWNTHVWRSVTSGISPQRVAMIQPHFDESRGDLIWVVPQNADTVNTDVGPPQSAYVIHYLEGLDEEIPQPHTYRQLPATGIGYFQRLTTLTWDQLTDQWQNYNFRWNDQFFQATFPLTLFGDNTGNVFILNNDSKMDGAAMTVYARFSRRPLVDSRTRGVVNRVYPYIDPQVGQTHSITVTMRSFANDSGNAHTDYTQTYPVDYETSATSTGFAAFRAPGLFTEIEFGTTGAQQPFSLNGYDLDVSKGGQR